MPSRVIHIRIDDWVLLGCHDVMKEGKDSVDNIPMATIVRNVLTALIRKLQNTNQIPTYTKEEAYDRAMEIYSGAEELNLDIALADIIEPEGEKEEDMTDLVKEALRQIEQEGAPEGLAEKVEITETSTLPEMPLTTINLLKIDSVSFHFIQKQSPKDRFVEWAADKEAAVKKAVCIVYDGLPKQLWGSEKAENMIKDLLARHIED